VASNYWQILELENFPVSWAVDGLYIYILVNGAAAAPFIYLERRARRAPQPLCPQCQQPLQTALKYECPDCGKLQFSEET